MKLDTLKKNKHKYNNWKLSSKARIASDFSIKEGEKRKRIDAIRNRISHFNRRHISQPKTQ